MSSACFTSRSCRRPSASASGPWPWLLRSGAPDPMAPEVAAARQAYEQALAELDRLIPEPMRGGLPLEPDAIRVFSRCDRADFG